MLGEGGNSRIQPLRIKENWTKESLGIEDTSEDITEQRSLLCLLGSRARIQASSHGGPPAAAEAASSKSAIV